MLTLRLIVVLKSLILFFQGITVKAVCSNENKEKIIVARILSGGLADNFGKKFLFTTIIGLLFLIIEDLKP